MLIGVGCAKLVQSALDSPTRGAPAPYFGASSAATGPTGGHFASCARLAPASLPKPQKTNGTHRALDRPPVSCAMTRRFSGCSNSGASSPETPASRAVRNADRCDAAFGGERHAAAPIGPPLLFGISRKKM